MVGEPLGNRCQRCFCGTIGAPRVGDRDRRTGVNASECVCSLLLCPVGISQDSGGVQCPAVVASCGGLCRESSWPGSPQGHPAFALSGSPACCSRRGGGDRALVQTPAALASHVQRLAGDVFSMCRSNGLSTGSIADVSCPGVGEAHAGTLLVPPLFRGVQFFLCRGDDGRKSLP